MPPQNSPSPTQVPLEQNSIPPRIPHKEPVGPLVGAAIVIFLLILGGLYSWGARLNHQNSQDKLPLITGDTATTTP